MQLCRNELLNASASYIDVIVCANVVMTHHVGARRFGAFRSHDCLSRLVQQNRDGSLERFADAMRVQ